jgi:hypothetical protein
MKKGTATVTLPAAKTTETGDSTKAFLPRASGGSVDGEYARRASDRSGENGYYLRFDQTTPFTTCSFTKDCGLRIYKRIVDDNTPPGPFEGDGYICYGSPGQAVRCRPSFASPPEGYQPLNCVTTSVGVLSCSTSEGASIYNECARTVGRVTDTNVWVLDFAPIEGCSQLTISAVPVGQ